MSFIYAIENAEGAVKIGLANDPLRRLYEIRVASVSACELISYIEGGRDLEVRLHHQFSPWRIRGEWFRKEGAVLEFVERLPSDPVKITCTPAKAVFTPSVVFPIIDKIGGWDAALEILQGARKRPSGTKPIPGAAALKKWKSERRIPAINIMILRDECDRLGIGWSRKDFEAQVPNETTGNAFHEVAA